ncbi:RnfH family protein [Methyloversatilis sp.]|uniref:RnfH family protein n=1 Tax=Methyloversatilis sp. TaxID=2569862 RepID=UPI0035AD9E3D
MSEKIRVQVAYALLERQDIVTVELVAGATAQQAIEASGLLQKYPDIDLAKNKLGIFSRLVKADQALRDRDRVEIYRALIADPKEVRRQRAAEGKVLKKGGGEAEPVS